MGDGRPNLLVIAASDSSGGSGMQADLRVCSALDVHALCAVTAVTAQGPGTVHAQAALAPEVVSAQLAAVARLPVAAVKIGVLPTSEIAAAVADWLAARDLPVVLDPVFESSGGQVLCEPRARRTIKERIVPKSALVTPNGPEFAALAGAEPAGSEEAVALARRLAGPGGAVLLKGGHGSGPECEDLLISESAVRSFVHPRAIGLPVRGTGCALATAVAAGLARSLDLDEAVELGIDYVQRGLTESKVLGDLVRVL